MSTEKLEYDSSIGGPVVLGSHLPTYRYASAVLKEMKQLLTEVRNPNNTKLVFQTLPKHMRRRAMSHHPKRLPRKHRFAHNSQMAKSGKQRIIKRHSRKYRRRPQVLLRAYLRRQRRNVWLETHIWHARRFHMIERWGYRLPFASCDKTYRACYRASTEHCLLQDISFHVCLQLEGSLDELRLGFARISSVKCGLSIAAKTFISGKREGDINLFRDGQYPAGAIARVSFMWRPLTEDHAEGIENIRRTLWLWVHPSAYHAVLEELIKIFELNSMKSVKIEVKSDPDADTMEIDSENEVKEKSKKSSKSCKKGQSIKERRQLQFKTKNCSYEHFKLYASTQGTVELSDLKDAMNRFRLTGPLSQAVLTHAFKVKQIELDAGENTNWWQTLLAQENNFQNYHEDQANYWQQCKQLSSPAELLSNMILALNIEDPRINRPHKRTKAVPNDSTDSTAILGKLLTEMPTSLQQSSLWNTKLRANICAQQISTKSYCKLRGKHAIVPGAECKFEKALQPVPVLLIQRPGSQDTQYKRLGYGCGWDVIVPAGYGMPVWLSLIMWGAKPGGLRESASIARELGTELHLPDTVGGRQLASERYAELRFKYFRLPSNKRCNYRKCAILSPFRAPFTELLRDWLPVNQASVKTTQTTAVNATTPFHILRDRVLLQELQLWLVQKRNDTLPKDIPPNCLIQLHLRMNTRGNPDDFAIVCLPTRADFKRQLKQIKHENNEPVFTEPLHDDANAKERKHARLEHRKLLKRLRARRVREKRKKQETSSTRVFIRPAGTAHLVSAQFSKMCSLWLSENDCSKPHSVRKQCTREVFGYVSTANYSYTEATVCAIAYVTVQGLQELWKVCKHAHAKHLMCLVRGTNTHQYRFATFKLNLHV